MSDQTAQEPTMEEILASIRRIISEDDQPQGEADAAAEPQDAPEPEPEAAAPADEDVLELTQEMREPDPVETVGDLDVYTPRATEPEPEPEPQPEPAVSYEPEPEPYTPPPAREPDDGLVGQAASAAAASAFSSLTAAISMPRDGRTLEDVTRELLKPLLKSWLDENLPRIVEAAVQEEVARIARGRG